MQHQHKTNAIREEALRLIDGATSRIVVSSFGWDSDHEIVKRLCTRAREGLEVVVLARRREGSMPALLTLSESGASVHGFKWLHAKAIWTDSGQALVMSANLQKYGMNESFELGVRLSGTRAQAVLETLEAWKLTARWVLDATPKLGLHSGKVVLWQNGEFVDVEIKTSMTVNLGKLVADSAAMSDTNRPPLPDNGKLPRLAHELDCEWEVVAPIVSPKAKEQFKPALNKNMLATSFSPPVFMEPGGRVVVVVSSPDELTRASKVMAEVGASTIVVST